MSSFYNSRALVSARDSGYNTTTNALAEIIDNSFDAESSKVRLIFLEKLGDNNRRYIDEILICDDGNGMSKEILQVCLQFGGGTNTDIDEIVANNKKGKFGYGLPNASLSQCPNIGVYSWQDDEEPLHTYLNLKEISDNDTIDIPEVQQVALPEHYASVGAILSKNHGTIISWRECDRLSHKRSQSIATHAEALLGRLFRYLLKEGKVIEIAIYEHHPKQGKFSKKSGPDKVKCNDPLFLTEECVLASTLNKEALGHPNEKVRAALKPFNISNKKCKPTNRRLEDQCFKKNFSWKGKKYPVQFKTSVAEKSIQKPGVREGGNTAVGRFYGDKESNGSISFVRAGREISSGRYGLYSATDARNRWWSIEVSFTPQLDELLGVTNDKQSIAFSKTSHAPGDDTYSEWEADLQEARTEFWVQLSKWLMIIRKEAYKVVKTADQSWEEQNVGPGVTTPGPPEGTTGTTSSQGNTDGKRTGQFEESQKEELLTALKARYSEHKEEDLKNAIERYDDYKSRGILLYAPSEGDFLWSLTSVAGFLIVYINTNHEFYTGIMEPFRRAKMESALTGIELFISSLAFDEYEHFWTNETVKNTLEEYRSYVGLHLRRYLRDNHVQITDDEFSSVKGITTDGTDKEDGA